MSKEQPVFERVPSQVVAPEAEERILEFWEKEDIFKKSIEIFFVTPCHFFTMRALSLVCK